MSGHSKWNNIKHKKGAADAKRGAIFTKLGREIALAVKEGGADPDSNTRLAQVIVKAKAVNMPNDNINRSIQKAAGSGNEDHFEVIVYEGYGLGGVAVMVRCLSDNRNRTAGEVRHGFSKYGGNLGTTGSVAFMFQDKGTLVIERDDSMDEETIMMEALEAGASDIEVEDEAFIITTEPEDFVEVEKTLGKRYSFAQAEIVPTPDNYISLDDPEQREAMSKMIEALEDLDDVQDVYHNWEEDDEA